MFGAARKPNALPAQIVAAERRERLQVGTASFFGADMEGKLHSAYRTIPLDIGFVDPRERRNFHI